MNITTKEMKERSAYILLAVFAFYLVEPLRSLINEYMGDIPEFAIGIVGIIAVLYFFKL